MYSILMSVYSGESPSHLGLALESIYQSGITSDLDEIVMVWDGQLSEELKNTLASWSARLPIKNVCLDRNVGLASALNHGLKHVMSEWTMRFDTDDIFMPNRFAVQRQMMDGPYDLIGGQIEEFMTDEAQPHQARAVPLNHQEIVARSRSRNPFNHMTVCFRTDLVKNIGGYPHIPLMEDYALWVNMICAGARCVNSMETLVKVRIGAGMYSRRGGIRYVRSEYKMQQFLYRVGLKSLPLAVAHGSARGLVFSLPSRIRQIVYERFLRG